MLLPEAPSVRVGMRYCVQRVPLGSQIEYQVQRGGERLTLYVRATTRKPRLLPPRHPVPRPEWLILGGLVFTPLLPDYEVRACLALEHEPTPECCRARTLGSCPPALAHMAGHAVRLTARLFGAATRACCRGWCQSAGFRTSTAHRRRSVTRW